MIRVLLVVMVVLAVASMAPQREAVAQEGLSISGAVWFDENGDGAKQPDEVGTIHRRVLLSGPGGLSRQTETDRDGRYTFLGLQSGGYVVSLPEETWMAMLTFPERQVRAPFTRSVELGSSSVVDVNFGFGATGPLTGFSGLAFINAAPADAPDVRAFIDGVDCSGPPPLLPTDMDHATYSISVLPSSLLAGCGEDGDVITFTINGLTANETAVYTTPMRQQGPPLITPPDQAPSQRRSTLNLTVGPPFHVYWPRVEERDAAGERVWGYGYTVAAMIDGRVCAVGLPRVWDSIMMIVPTETTKPGCGREGAIVSFAVEGFATSDTRVWSANSQAEYEELVLELVKSETAALAGLKFAYYWIDLPEMVATHPLFDEVEQTVIATIDGKYCGQARNVGPRRVLVAVPPAELREGCGRPGATVTLSQTDTPYATVRWQPGFHEGPAAPGMAQGGELAPQDEPTPPPESGQISPPSVGDAGLRR